MFMTEQQIHNMKAYFYNKGFRKGIIIGIAISYITIKILSYIYD